MKKKIYITSLHMMHGGVEMAISLQANAFVKRGYDVEILCIYNLGEPVYKLDDRVKLTYLSNVHPNKEEFLKAKNDRNIIAIIKEGIYAVNVLYLKKKVMIDAFRKIQDGVIVSTRNEHTVLLSKYGNKSVKKVAHLHHDHRFDKKLLRDFANSYDNIDVFMLLTDELQKEASKIMKDNKKTEIMTMPNFLEETQKHIEEEKSREKQVIAVGRLDEVKGFKRLILLWKKLSEREDVILKIVGDGEQKEELEKIIAEQNLQGKVVLTGSMEHNKVLKEMRKSLLYVMTSYTEGFPFVLLEAMSEGLPAVAYDVRVGPRAIIQEGENGYLVADEDEKAFVDSVVTILEDDKLRRIMSQNAIKRAKDFSEENIMKRWEKVIG